MAGFLQVLDWELAHLGDRHEDLAFGCMTVWRFGRLDKQGFGLGTVVDLARAYEAAGGTRFDPARFRFWLVYRTVWWALSALSMGRGWRSGADRSLERVVVARRAAEQDLDLLLLLEAGRARGRACARPTALCQAAGAGRGRTKRRRNPHRRVRMARRHASSRIWRAGAVRTCGGAEVRSASLRRELAARPSPHDKALSEAILARTTTLAQPGLLAALRRRVLDTLAADMPKYPALSEAPHLGENLMNFDLPEDLVA